MTRPAAYRHEFVEFIPEEIAEGILYVSIKYSTASHLCMCGCGSKIVTPLAPSGWSIVFDGETISLRPSIGNWSYPCQSHYWLRRARVEWAATWKADKIAAGREFAMVGDDDTASRTNSLPDGRPAAEADGEGFLARVKATAAPSLGTVDTAAQHPGRGPPSFDDRIRPANPLPRRIGQGSRCYALS